MSSRKKMDVVLRVLRGDALDLVSREAGITAAKGGSVVGAMQFNHTLSSTLLTPS